MDRRSQDGALLQLVHANREAAAEGHKRNRERVESAAGRIATLEASQTELRDRLSALERTPVSADKVTFSGRFLMTVLGVAVGLAGGMYQLHVGINDLQTAVVNTAKMQDERNQTQKDMIDNLGRQIEMRRVEIQRLSDRLTEFMQAKGK